MNNVSVECLQSYLEFQAIREDWDEFMMNNFPENYARTHAWLSAYWMTHHPGQSALIYIQWDVENRRIIATAPLIIKKENFGGFRVRMLQALGRGVGCDDFLLGSTSCQVVQAVFSDLKSRQTWDVSIFRRVSHTRFQDELAATSLAMSCHTDSIDSTEHFVLLPQTYIEYVGSRSSKFRNNLKNAIKRLEMAGGVSIEVLSPFTQADRALTLCEEVAKKSWQFKTGKSHFNTNSSACFYNNLVKTGCGAGGEEFVVLLVADKPVAFMLGCKRGRSYHLIDTAYDEEFRAISVGRVLFCKTIERLIESGEVDRFNLEGDGEYKEYFANNAETAHQITMYSSSLYGRCISSIRKTGLYHRLKKLLECRCDGGKQIKHSNTELR